MVHQKRKKHLCANILPKQGKRKLTSQQLNPEAVNFVIVLY